MNLLLQKEIDALRDKGIGLGDLTVDEVEALVHAVDRLADPFGEVNADAVGMPVRVSGAVVFWPMTIGACVWLEEYARKWWGSEGKSYFWAVVYCLVHGRDKDAFARLLDEEAAFKAVRDNALGLCVHEAEVIDAMDRALGLGRPKEPRKKGPAVDTGTDWASIVARLESQTGIPAEKWCWGRSADYAMRCYQDLSAFAQKYAGGRSSRRMRDEVDRAVSAIARTRAAIVERVEAGRAAKEVAQ